VNGGAGGPDVHQTPHHGTAAGLRSQSFRISNNEELGCGSEPPRPACRHDFNSQLHVALDDAATASRQTPGLPTPFRSAALAAAVPLAVLRDHLPR
jgi:hypothetical protein